jgi:lipopolysaccharide heptosyltransferase II
VRALREKYPDGVIDLLVRNEYSEIAKSFTGLSSIKAIDVKSDDLGQLNEQLRNAGYDFVVDLHNNFRSRKLRKGVGARLGVINKRTLRRLLLVKWKVNLLRDEPDVIGRYFEAAAGLGVADTGVAPRLTHERASGRIVILAPGARHWNKRWPAEYFADVARALIAQGYTVELHGSTADRETTDRIAQQLNGHNVENLAGTLTITDAKNRIAGAALVVTNDSGLMHVASAVRTPTIALFGPTVREFGFVPRAETTRVLENVGLYCRPCTTIGREDCPEKHFRCLREITPTQVLHEIELLAG